MRRLRTIAVCLLLASAAARAGQGTAVLLPFYNFSGAQSAPGQMRSQMEEALKRRGWTVADPEKVDAILEAERVRYLDSLEPALVHKILASAGAQAIVSGTVYEYSDSRNPIVAVAGRMIDSDGAVVWSDLAAVSADDTEQILGFGRKGALVSVADEAVRRLARRLPGPDLHRALVRGPSRPLLQSSPASYRSHDLAGSKQRVCVLPFDNTTALPEAGRIVTDIVALRLAASDDFEVVEPATMREGALKARIGSFRGIGSDDLARLAGAVGTPLFVRGTVYTFVDPAGRPGAVPELQVELSLVDVTSGHTLWIAQNARKGTDYIGFLMLGNVSNVVSLTDRVVTEMIDAEEHAPHGAEAARTARAKTSVPEKHSELRKEK